MGTQEGGNHISSHVDFSGDNSLFCTDKGTVLAARIICRPWVGHCAGCFKSFLHTVHPKRKGGRIFWCIFPCREVICNSRSTCVRTGIEYIRESETCNSFARCILSRWYAYS